LGSAQDHPWHRALWFSWKFINGVNYWEPNAQNGTLDGRTEWSDLQPESGRTSLARLSIEITYRPADGTPVLKERRVIAIAPPAQDGSYSMDWQMTFTALDKLSSSTAHRCPVSRRESPGVATPGCPYDWRRTCANARPLAPRARSGSRRTPIAFDPQPWTYAGSSTGARRVSPFLIIRRMFRRRHPGI